MLLTVASSIYEMMYSNWSILEAQARHMTLDAINVYNVRLEHPRRAGIGTVVGGEMRMVQRDAGHSEVFSMSGVSPGPSTANVLTFCPEHYMNLAQNGKLVLLYKSGMPVE